MASSLSTRASSSRPLPSESAGGSASARSIVVSSDWRAGSVAVGAMAIRFAISVVRPMPQSACGRPVRDAGRMPAASGEGPSSGVTATSAGSAPLVTLGSSGGAASLTGAATDRDSQSIADSGSCAAAPADRPISAQMAAAPCRAPP